MHPSSDWGKCFQRSGSENILPLYLVMQTFLSCFFSASPPTPSRPRDRLKRKNILPRGQTKGAALNLAVRALQPAVPPKPFLYSVSVLELKNNVANAPAQPRIILQLLSPSFCRATKPFTAAITLYRRCARGAGCTDMVHS